MTTDPTSPELRRLVACPGCALQYDATGHEPPGRFRCACGEVVVVEAGVPAEAAVVRCSACGAPRRHAAPACEHCGADFTLHERDLHTLCPGCVTRISDRARHCHACGIAIVPQGRVGALTDRPCPVCGESHRLYSRNVEGQITVLECDHCAGLWLGHRIFELLETASERALEPLGEVEAAPVTDVAALDGTSFYRACPQCSKLMHRRNYGRKSGVIVDVCQQDGIWFDRGELDRILAWRRDGGALRAERLAAETPPARDAGAATPTLPDLMGDGDHPALDFIEMLLDALLGFLRR